MSGTATPATAEASTWRFPRTFWFANSAELCERAAYYGMFITLYRYLNQDVGFTDINTGWVISVFAGGIYFLPTFMGIMADRIGFKQALMVAFALLTVGYGLLGSFQLKSTAMISLGLIMCGGAIIKPVISGTAAKCSTDANRARAMSIFYMVVNIGSFSGKGLAGVLNEELGLQYINYYAAGMTFLAFVVVSLFYRNVDEQQTGKTVGDAFRGLGKVVTNFRFMALIFIVAGFWLIQGQLYGAMPTYIERVLGKGYKPEWLANINPLTVVLFVVPITHLVRKFRAENAIGIGLAIIPFTALVIAVGPWIAEATGGSVDLGGWKVHPVILLIIVGIALQGLAECFLSPKFLEYVSKQAPPGEVGLYLGYGHLHSFVAWFIAFIMAGLLLDSYCPDPRKQLDADTRHEWRLAVDDQYQCTLEGSPQTTEGESVTVPEWVRSALTAHDIKLPADAVLTELEPKDSWQTDPERRWEITTQTPADAVPAQPDLEPKPADSEGTPGTVLYTIEEEKLESNADAASAGREHALRDVLVHAVTARALADRPPLPAEYDRAHYIWFAFAGVGIAAFLALLVFKFVTQAIDRGQAAGPV